MPFAQTLKTYLKDHPDLEKRILEKYGEISFNVSSQLIENEETGQIGVFFPIKKGRKYTGVVFAVVNKSHTYFFFNVYGEEIEEIKSVLNIFDKNVAKYQLNKVCGDEGNECYINEVELIRYRPDREQNRNTHTIWNDSGFSIFSGAIGEPTINFGGGGGRGHRPKNTPPNNDPCTEMKAMNVNANYNAKVNELNKPSVLRQKYETGYSEDRNGNFTELKKGESTSNSDALKMSISKNTKGYTHTHQDDYETGNIGENGAPEIRKPIRMYSPSDVNTIMEIAKLRDDGDYGDIYGTMVASNGVYTIKFTGTKNDIKTGFDTDYWRKEYIKYMSIGGGSLETKFLRFMKEKMGVSGISLFETKRNGEVKRIELNDRNKAKATDC